MINFLHSFINAVETLNNVLAKYLAWLTGVMAIVIFLIVVGRSAFDMGSIALQESITYMHTCVFMVCLAYTAQEGGHVRVDIFYRRQDTASKAWVDVVGATIFLLPFSLFMFAISWNFVISAWHIKEGSIDPGGIPALYLMKTLIPIAAFLLALRAITEVISNLLHLTFLPASSAQANEQPKG
ncbi:TRAP transporter small permease subunit [Agarilytica rhodophyticola]|uniref:TRAP transporter small permease subunit n=1 Tax=Agarilytica rhodophyticola TaxID=1737490 RepID=UPI000B3420EF|nr:TRAP transporter small permease subunit [Agarilytica rhodophyticola]